MSGYTIAKYLRISNEDKDLRQVGKTESNSITNQSNLLDDFIRRTSGFEGADILEFCDDGWSGKNFERPAVTQMLEQVRRGNIQCIIVKDLSRFGRDYLEVGNYLSRVFPFLGVRFIAVNDGFDSIRPMEIDSLETSFKTLLYDLYSRDLSRKVRSAKQFKAERGDFLSPFAPYGFVKNPKNKNQLLIDQDTAEIVRRVFREAAEGCSTMQIAHGLNDEGIPTPMRHKRAAGCSRTVWPSVQDNNFWTHIAVTKILRDQRYIGKNVYGRRIRTQVGSAYTQKVSRADWITVEDTHAGIVTQVEFERAQARLREWTEFEAGKHGGTPFYRKIRCGVCGHCMCRMKAKEPYYVCQTTRVTNAYACSTEHITERDLMEAVGNALRIQAHYAVEMGRIWEEKHRRKKQDTGAIVKTLASLQENLSQLRNYIKSLYEQFALGELDKDGYLAAKDAAVQKRDETAARIELWTAKFKNANQASALENRFIDRFQQYAEVEEITAEITADVLQEVVVYPDGRLHIVWNYQDDLKQLLLDEDVESAAAVGG